MTTRHEGTEKFRRDLERIQGLRELARRGELRPFESSLGSALRRLAAPGNDGESSLMKIARAKGYGPVVDAIKAHGH